MKAAYKLNYFFVAMPPILALCGMAEDNFIYYSLLSFIPLGMYHIIVAIRFATHLSKNIHYKIYVLSVQLFFVLAFTMDFWWDSLAPFGEIFYGIPSILAIYFSIILHQNSQKS